MTYASIMVVLAPGQDNSAVLALAADSASRIEAHVLGMGACEMMPVNYGGEYVSGGLVQLDQEDINKDLAGTEKAFRDALKGTRPDRGGRLRSQPPWRMDAWQRDARPLAAAKQTPVSGVSLNRANCPASRPLAPRVCETPNSPGLNHGRRVRAANAFRILPRRRFPAFRMRTR